MRSTSGAGAMHTPRPARAVVLPRPAPAQAHRRPGRTHSTLLWTSLLSNSSRSFLRSHELRWIPAYIDRRAGSQTNPTTLGRFDPKHPGELARRRPRTHDEHPRWGQLWYDHVPHRSRHDHLRWICWNRDQHVLHDLHRQPTRLLPRRVGIQGRKR